MMPQKHAKQSHIRVCGDS